MIPAERAVPTIASWTTEFKWTLPRARASPSPNFHLGNRLLSPHFARKDCFREHFYPLLRANAF